MSNRFGYPVTLGFIAVLFVATSGCGSIPVPSSGPAHHISAFGQRMSPTALQTLSQTRSPSSGANFECNPTSNFGYWNITTGTGGYAFIDGPSKGGDLTQCLLEKGFGFSLPQNATITSISVSFSAYISVQNGKQPVRWCPQVTVNGQVYNGGGICSPSEGNTTPQTFTVSAPAANWETGFNATNVNASFELCFQANPSATQDQQYEEDVYLTNPQVTIYYTD